jgi:hypothetical protein
MRFSMNLELRDRLFLEAFDKHNVAWRHTTELLRQFRLRLIQNFMHQYPALRRRKHDFARTRLAVPVRVLARLIDVEGVMGMFDQ